MNQKPTLVPKTNLQQLVEERKIFWSVFTTWSSSAPDAEFEQLERVLIPHAHHVRPLPEALADAVAEQARDSRAPRVPVGLLALLQTVKWPPATHVGPALLAAA